MSMQRLQICKIPKHEIGTLIQLYMKYNHVVLRFVFDEKFKRELMFSTRLVLSWIDNTV